MANNKDIIHLNVFHGFYEGANEIKGSEQVIVNLNANPQIVDLIQFPRVENFLRLILLRAVPF